MYSASSHLPGHTGQQFSSSVVMPSMCCSGLGVTGDDKLCLFTGGTAADVALEREKKPLSLAG